MQTRSRSGFALPFCCGARVEIGDSSDVCGDGMCDFGHFPIRITVRPL
jgi:hypothetical protein